MRSDRRESRAIAAGKWLFAAVVPTSALALGSIPTSVLLVMSALAALALALLASDREGWTLSTASRWVLAAFALLLAMTILQAIPLPNGLTRSLAPASADIWERALSPLHEPGPAWHPLSVAPLATRVEVLRGFFYGCIFLGALRIAALERGEQLLVRLVIFSTVVMAVASLAHMAVGAERVFGVYRPHEIYAYRVGRLTPLLNTNHLAAYLNIGACVALWALVARRSLPRALSASAVLVLAATSIWQGSRGATGTLALGAVVAIGLTFYVKRRFGSERGNAAVLAGCLVAAAFMGTIAFFDPGETHLLSTDLTKADVARSSLRLIAASSWFGMGRGAFETVFSSVREGTSYVTFTHPEDIAVQWLVEWGVPVSLLGFGMLTWALRPQLVLRAARPVVGVWVAIVVTVLHEVVDFHLEVPGVVALVAICVAIVVSSRPSSPSRTDRKTTPASPTVLVAPAIVVGTALASILAWPAVGHSLAEDRRALSARSVDAAMPPEAFRAVAREAMLRYPAEPFLPLMGAVRAQVNHEGSVVPWIARSLERSPRFGRAHFVLARSLVVGHAPQARLEYRLAYENDATLRDAVVKEVVRVVDDSYAALELVPEGPAGVDMLEALVTELGDRLPATAVLLDREIALRQPTAPGPSRRRAEAEASDAIGDASWCQPAAACLAAASAAAGELARREPTRCSSHLLVARLGIAQHQAQAALDRLERSLDVVVDRGACQRQLISLAMESGQNRRAELALDALVRGGCGGAADCIQLYSWAANVEEQRGHYVRAVRLNRRLIDLDPSRDDVLEHIGSLGDRDGVLADALDAYGSLALRHPDDARWPARISELRGRRAPPGPTLPAIP